MGSIEGTVMRFHTLIAAAGLAIAYIAPAHALTITQNTNIAGGMAAFGASNPVITWSNIAPGPYAAGALGPVVGGGSQIDPMTGTMVTGNLAIANWIDGDGFSEGATAVADLALNGDENFSLLTFASPVSRIAFAVATGRGNLLSEVDQLGASFLVETGNGNFFGDSGMLILPATPNGGGYAAWIVISSATPFTQIRFGENPSNIQDQYFGDFVSARVPEPAAWTMMIGGFGIVGTALRRRRRMIAQPA